MKKYCRFALVIVLLLSVGACGDKNESTRLYEERNNANEIVGLNRGTEQTKRQLQELLESNQENQDALQFKYEEVPLHSDDVEGEEKVLKKAPENEGESATEVQAEQREKSPSGFEKYKGRFFDVEYPANFTLLSEEVFDEPNPESYPGTDGITVQSPDGRLEFYVYSPLCSGNPEWKETRDGEGEGEVTVEEAENHLITRGSFVSSKYTRFFEERKGKYDMPCISVFGLKYTNAADYEPFKQDYLHFKNSLLQYWWD